VEEGGSESRKDGVGEKIDVEDWQEELGGGQTESMRSQVREFCGRERHSPWGAGFVAGKEDLNDITRLEQGKSRAERKKSLDKWNFRSLAIAVAEIVKI
jgi:hypothetical protein